MTTTVEISLPLNQLDLLNRIEQSLAKLNASQNNAAWLNMDEVCKRFDVKEGTIYKWMKSEKMPYSRIETVTRFNTTKVDAWFEKKSMAGLLENMNVHNRKHTKAA